MTLTTPTSSGEPGARHFEREAEIARQLLALGGHNARLRSEAARRLGELRAGSEALLQSLSDTHSQVRAAAADALGFTADTEERETRGEVVDALLAAIDDANDYVCSAAIRALGRLRAPECREDVEACLEDANPHIVQAAILTLARLGAGDQSEKLASYLKSDNEYLRSAAATAVGMLNYREAGEALVSALEDSLHGENRWRNKHLQSELIQTIGRLKVKEGIPLLVDAARTEVGLRSKAVQALIELEADQATALLAELLLDPGNSLRTSMLNLVARTGYTPALALVRPLLKDENGQVRQAALDAVSCLNDKASIRTVRKMAARDPNPYIRVRAVRCLAALAEEDALGDLLRLLGDTNAYVRQAAAQCCENYPALPRAILGALEELANCDPAEGVQAAAQSALAAQRERPVLADERFQPSRRSLNLPAALQDEREALLYLLERWQDGLAPLARGERLNEINEVDQALHVLIAALEQDDEEEPE